MERVNHNLEFENARIMFPNFRGLPTKFDPAGGKRSFCVAIPDPDMAQQMRNEGWNVRVLAPRNEDEMPLDYMQVKVAFGNVPPKIIMIANGVQTPLDELDVGQLDTAEIQSVDLVIRPYNWNVRGDTGVTAYQKSDAPPALAYLPGPASLMRRPPPAPGMMGQNSPTLPMKI